MKTFLSIALYLVLFQCQAQKKNMNDLKHCGYPYIGGFINLDRLTNESKPLPPEINYKILEPQASLFRMMGVQSNWHLTEIQMKNHTYRVGYETEADIDSNGNVVGETSYYYYEIKTKKDSLSYHRMIIGSLENYHQPFWIKTDTKAILVVHQRDLQTRFFVFDDHTGKLIHTISMEKAYEEFTYIAHLNNALYYRQKIGNQYIFCEIDILKNKITEYAPQKEPIANILIHQIPETDSVSLLTPDVGYAGIIYLAIHSGKPVFAIAIPGTTLYIPIPKELLSEKGEVLNGLRNKKIIALSTGKKGIQFIWIAIHHSFSTGVSLYRYNVQPIEGQESMQKLDVEYYPIDHSEYYNQVYLSAYDGKIILEGNESSINYVQVFEEKTGKRLFATPYFEDK